MPGCFAQILHAFFENFFFLETTHPRMADGRDGVGRCRIALGCGLYFEVGGTWGCRREATGCSYAFTGSCTGTTDLF